MFFLFIREYLLNEIFYEEYEFAIWNMISHYFRYLLNKYIMLLEIGLSRYPKIINKMIQVAEIKFLRKLKINSSGV